MAFMPSFKKVLLACCVWLINTLATGHTSGTQHWGFFAHKFINRHAVYILPAGMKAFYKQHINTIEQLAVLPDQRRYTNPYEAPKHFIDLELYGDSALLKLPGSWVEFKRSFSLEQRMQAGIVPWHIHAMAKRLTHAFLTQDAQAVIKLSAELGHYVADAHVPLHTTVNYNGQLTNQQGIHAFWESRMPELFAHEYNLATGPAVYLESTRQEAWNIVAASHALVNPILQAEKTLSRNFPAHKKYSIEPKGKATKKVYSRAYSQAYHEQAGQYIAQRMRAAIFMTASYWYTCWVNAGQPNLANWQPYQQPATAQPVPVTGMNKTEHLGRG